MLPISYVERWKSVCTPTYSLRDCHFTLADTNLFENASVQPRLTSRVHNSANMWSSSRHRSMHLSWIRGAGTRWWYRCDITELEPVFMHDLQFTRVCTIARRLMLAMCETPEEWYDFLCDDAHAAANFKTQASNVTKRRGKRSMSDVIDECIFNQLTARCFDHYRVGSGESCRAV